MPEEERQRARVRRPPARRRQDRHPQGDPQQAGQAHRRGVRAHEDPHDRGPVHARPRGRPARPRSARSCAPATSAGTAAATPTASRASRSPSPPGSCSLRRLQRHDHRPRLPQGACPREDALRRASATTRAPSSTRASSPRSIEVIEEGRAGRCDRRRDPGDPAPRAPARRPASARRLLRPAAQSAGGPRVHSPRSSTRHDPDQHRPRARPRRSPSPRARSSSTQPARREEGQRERPGRDRVLDAEHAPGQSIGHGSWISSRSCTSIRPLPKPATRECHQRDSRAGASAGRDEAQRHQQQAEQVAAPAAWGAAPRRRRPATPPRTPAQERDHASSSPPRWLPAPRSRRAARPR